MLLLEYEKLQGTAPLGMYVIPTLESLQEWHGVVFVQQGFYRNGVFRFKIIFPEDYPESPPTVHFLSEMFHALVAPGEGRVDMEALCGGPWQPGWNCAAYVLPRLKRMLHRREFFAPAEPLNPKAKELFLLQDGCFASRAAECARKSHDN